MSTTGRIARLALTVVAAGAVAATAGGTPPGTNGRIAFTRYTDESRTAGAIFAVTVDGRRTERLTSPRGAVDQHPDWSPDGSRIVFERCRRVGTPSEACEVGIVGARGGRVEVLRPSCGRGEPQRVCPLVRGPAFTRSGAVVVGVGWGELMFQPANVTCACVDNEREHSELVVLNPDGSTRRTLYALDEWRGSLNRPQVSPDGRTLVFERRNSWRSRPRGGSALFVLGMDGTRLRQVTQWNLAAGDGPDWSPDGKRLVFRAPRVGDFAGSNIYTVGADGEGLRQVTRFPASVEVLSASYSPDGAWIVFSRSGLGGLPDLFVVRPDGSGLRQVTRTPTWESAPDWGPSAR